MVRFLFEAIPAVRSIFCLLALLKRMPLPSGLNGLSAAIEIVFKKRAIAVHQVFIIFRKLCV